MVVIAMIMMDILSFLWNLVSILFLSIVAIMLTAVLVVTVMGTLTTVCQWVVNKLWRQEDGSID
jgi:hypothetical protein